jgi:uncharacterized protein YbjT (DUF2867 family)
MKVLIAGAAGFIGSHLAVALHNRGVRVVGAARNVEAARARLPHIQWIECDFTKDTIEDWQPRLEGFGAVINCVGVLQDGLKENSRATHIDGARALYKACRAADVRRVIHFSAVGVDDDAASGYARDKLAGERLLQPMDLDWVILRPSLVIARNTHGGTSLIRWLCGLPWITPIVGGDQLFRPIHVDDIADTVNRMLSPRAVKRVSWDLGGPQEVSMAELVTAYRNWLGFGKTRIWNVPKWLAIPAFKFGDLLGWMGVQTSMRSASLAQLEHDVAGDPSEWLKETGARPRALKDCLEAEMAGPQDRWYARLGFARPLARWMLGLFWLVTGLFSVTVSADAARAALAELGVVDSAQSPLLWATSLFDIALGLAMLAMWRVRAVAGLMLAGSFGYVAALSWLAPGLWLDVLGPVTKLFPIMALTLIIAATEEQR